MSASTLEMSNPRAVIVLFFVFIFANVAFASAVDNYIWVASRCSDYSTCGFAGTVSKIDKTTNAIVDNITVGAAPIGVAADDNYVWVASECGNDSTCNTHYGTISKIDKATDKVVDTISLPADSIPYYIAVDNCFVWVASQESSAAINMNTEGSITANGTPYNFNGTVNATTNGTALGWNGTTAPSNFSPSMSSEPLTFSVTSTLNASFSVNTVISKIDKINDNIVATWPLSDIFGGPGQIAIDNDSIWVIGKCSAMSTVSRISKIDGTETAEIDIANGTSPVSNGTLNYIMPMAILTDNDSVWVFSMVFSNSSSGSQPPGSTASSSISITATPQNGTITQIDKATNTIVNTNNVPEISNAMVTGAAVDNDSFWLPTFDMEINGTMNPSDLNTNGLVISGLTGANVNPYNLSAIGPVGVVSGSLSIKLQHMSGKSVNSRVLRIDKATGAIIATIPVTTGPEWPGIVVDNNSVWVTGSTIGFSGDNISLNMSNIAFNDSICSGGSVSIAGNMGLSGTMTTTVPPNSMISKIDKSTLAITLIPMGSKPELVSDSTGYTYDSLFAANQSCGPAAVQPTCSSEGGVCSIDSDCCSGGCVNSTCVTTTPAVSNTTQVSSGTPPEQNDTILIIMIILILILVIIGILFYFKDKWMKWLKDKGILPSEPQHPVSVNPQLVAWLKDNLAKGYDLESLTASMLKQGYTKDEIEAAITTAKTSLSEKIQLRFPTQLQSILQTKPQITSPVQPTVEVNPQLVSWLKDNLAKGYDLNSLKSSMLTQGYSQSEIQATIIAATAKPQPQPKAKPPVQPMVAVNPQLVAWLKANLAKGYDLKSLKTSMLEQGYSKEEIEAAINVATAKP